MKWSGVRHRIEYALVIAVRGVVSVFPDVVSRWIGTIIGLSFYVVDRSHRRLAMAQLQAAFPVRTEAECRAIARHTFVHFGQVLVTTLKVSTLEPAEVLARVEFEGVDRVRAALDRGKGAIVFSGHFGNWELLAHAHALVLPPMWLLARPLDNPYLHQLLEDMRRKPGSNVIYRQGALRRVLRALNGNEVVGILIDQHIHGSDAVLVDFFNRAAATTAALATLAERTGAPIVPGFALPLANGRFRVVYEHPVELPPGDDATNRIEALTQRCSDVLEMYVRRHPHLWLWMHRRWRDVPRVDTPVADMFPAGAPDESEATE